MKYNEKVDGELLNKYCDILYYKVIYILWQMSLQV